MKTNPTQRAIARLYRADDMRQKRDFSASEKNWARLYATLAGVLINPGERMDLPGSLSMEVCAGTRMRRESEVRAIARAPAGSVSDYGAFDFHALTPGGSVSLRHFSYRGALQLCALACASRK